MPALKEKLKVPRDTRGVVSSTTRVLKPRPGKRTIPTLQLITPYVRNLEKIGYLKKETTSPKNRKTETEEEDFIVPTSVSELITRVLFSSLLSGIENRSITESARPGTCARRQPPQPGGSRPGLRWR